MIAPVDVGHRASYVAVAMNLLLLLSALLSALTGVGAARSEVTSQAVCSQLVEANAPRAAAPAAIARPLQPLPALVALAVATDGLFALAPIEPLFASRRRE